MIAHFETPSADGERSIGVNPAHVVSVEERVAKHASLGTLTDLTLTSGGTITVVGNFGSTIAKLQR